MLIQGERNYWLHCTAKPLCSLPHRPPLFITPNVLLQGSSRQVWSETVCHKLFFILSDLQTCQFLRVCGGGAYQYSSKCRIDFITWICPDSLVYKFLNMQYFPFKLRNAENISSLCTHLLVINIWWHNHKEPFKEEKQNDILTIRS